MGTPTDETWPGHTKLPDYVQFKSYPATPLSDIFTAAGPDLIELMSKLLSLDPMRRSKCAEALKMTYFRYFLLTDMTPNFYSFCIFDDIVNFSSSIL